MKKIITFCLAFGVCLAFISWRGIDQHIDTSYVTVGTTLGDTVQSKDVANYVGKVVSVTETVVTTRLIASNNMTLLNVGAEYPNQDFTIMIKSENRNKFGQPDVELKGKTVTITGTVTDYRSKPEIELTDPAQLKIK